MENQSQASDTEKQIKDLSENSWNLELIISGAAVFMTTLLPDGIDALFRYYVEEVAPDNDTTTLVFPLLAYSFFKVVAWLLTCFFVLHFTMRAFWAGLIGLHAAFPSGIKYDSIPNYTDEMRDISRKKYGQLDAYILRLDKLTNQVFAFAFAVTLYGAAIGLIYLVTMVVLLGMQALFGENGATIVRLFLTYGITIAATALLLLSYWIKKKPEFAQKWGRTHAKLTLGMATMLPILSRPLQYLMLTFGSNISKKRYYAVVASISVLIFVLVGVVFLNKIGEILGRQVYLSRNFASSGAAYSEVSPRKYDNLRQPNDLVPTVSLPSDIIQERFVRLFVAIPKSLDADIQKRFSLPSLPDSLPKRQRRRQLDSLKITYFNQFFRVSLNDSTLQNVKWLFHQKPETGTLGIVTYLPMDQNLPGQYHISVEMMAETKQDSFVVWGEVPFWYSPEK